MRDAMSSGGFLIDMVLHAPTTILISLTGIHHHHDRDGGDRTNIHGLHLVTPVPTITTTMTKKGRARAKNAEDTKIDSAVSGQWPLKRREGGREAVTGERQSHKRRSKIVPVRDFPDNDVQRGSYLAMLSRQCGYSSREMQSKLVLFQ
jgi:hypothetical protein